MIEACIDRRHRVVHDLSIGSRRLAVVHHRGIIHGIHGMDWAVERCWWCMGHEDLGITECDWALESEFRAMTANPAMGRVLGGTP